MPSSRVRFSVKMIAVMEAEKKISQKTVALPVIRCSPCRADIFSKKKYPASHISKPMPNPTKRLSMNNVINESPMKIVSSNLLNIEVSSTSER